MGHCCEEISSLPWGVFFVSIHIWSGLPAHDIVFIFFTYLTGLFKSSVFNFFQNAFFIFNKCGKNSSSFFNMEENWVFLIFILQCRLEQIFIFVFKLQLVSSNLPENPHGAPWYYNATMLLHIHCNETMLHVGLYANSSTLAHIKSYQELRLYA